MAVFGIDIKGRLAELSGHKPRREGLCGLQITPTGLAVAYISHGENQDPHIQCYDFLPCEPKPEKIVSLLSTFVNKNNLVGVACSWVLRPQEYSLLPVGILPVAPEEIHQALEFYVKDRIKSAINKVVITHFTLPPLHKNSNDEFIYAVVAQKSYLENTARLIRQTGLELLNVDITEFAVRNVINVFARRSRKPFNACVIEVTEEQATLMFIQSDTIYLIRQIERDSKAPLEENFKKLSLEIQRSLDYYENELGQSSIQKFYVMPGVEELYPALKTSLPFELTALCLDDILQLSLEKEKNTQCFVAIGGALRMENTYAAAN